MDNSNRPSTFFTNMHELEIPEAKIHKVNEELHSKNSTPLPKGPIQEHHTPRWLIPLALLLITAQVLGVALWFGYKQEAAVRSSLNETISMLQLIEKHGYNVKGYYSQVREQSTKLNSPLALVQLGSVKGALATIDQEVSVQYKQLFDTEKKKLDAKITNLEGEISQTAAYSYPSKAEIVSYLQEVKATVGKGSVSIQQVEQYSEGVDTREKKLNTELEAVMKSEFAGLETEMAKATYYDFASHDKIEEYIQQTGGFNANHLASNSDFIGQLNLINSYTNTVKTEVEQEKKKVVFNNITAATSEVDTLLAFFAQRNGYTNEINLLNQYKNAVAQFTPEKTASLTSVQLQHNADTALLALLAVPRQSKVAAEAKEKQERLVAQKKLEVEKGIPVPPIDVPKLILIDVGKQRLYAYENGISIFDSAVPITTGKAGFDTIKGQFAVYSKYSPFRMRSPFPGITYDSLVDYVMFFYQGYGIHDASWRTVYGTMDYPALGSHGCVNTPRDYEIRLYAWSEIGTTVIVR